MSKQQIFNCDVCGRKKELANHWWIAFIAQRDIIGFFHGVTRQHQYLGGLSVFPWHIDLAGETDAIHLFAARNAYTNTFPPS